MYSNCNISISTFYKRKLFFKIECLRKEFIKILKCYLFLYRLDGSACSAILITGSILKTCYNVCLIF